MEETWQQVLLLLSNVSLLRPSAFIYGKRGMLMRKPTTKAIKKLSFEVPDISRFSAPQSSQPKMHLRVAVIFLVVVSMASLIAAIPQTADAQVAEAPKVTGLAGSNDGCKWQGTSPFCDGGCNVKGHFVKDTSKKGDGAECLSGIKVLCCPGINVSV